MEKHGRDFMINKRNGFTLIELLLATVILLLVLGLSMFSYNTLMSSWGRRLSDIEKVQHDYKNNVLFSNALSGIIPVISKAGSQTGFYFLGRTDGFTAVTNSPIFNPKSPAVIRILKETTDFGLQRLVYEEASLEEVLLLDAEQDLPFSHRLVIFDELKQIDFSYNSVPDINEPIELDNYGQAKERRKWLTSHDGLTARTHPTDLSISIDGFVIYVSVADRAGVLSARLGSTE